MKVFEQKSKDEELMKQMMKKREQEYYEDYGGEIVDNNQPMGGMPDPALLF